MKITINNKTYRQIKQGGAIEEFLKKLERKLLIKDRKDKINKLNNL